MKPAVLISLCLMGVECRYDGKGQALDGLDALMEHCALTPVCPEQLGGLPTPRTPSERLGDRVVTRTGEDVTAAFQRGADATCRLAAKFGTRYALLKARSPSCGAGEIYDGHFTGARVSGDGVTAAALRAMGVGIYNENQVEQLLRELEDDGR